MSENEKISLDQMIGTSEEPLVAAMHEGVLLLIINRPQARNALTLDMRKDFARLVERAEADAAVKAVIVIGAKGIFSAGADIKEVLQGPARIFRRACPRALATGPAPTCSRRRCWTARTTR